MTSPSPLLKLDGAVGADAPDEGVAAHYGSNTREQRRFESGDGFVDLSHRDVLTIAGADRLGWLHSLTTQHFENLEPGHTVQALLLSPQGRVEHAFTGVDDGETFWAHTEPGRGAALIEWLDSMRFMMRVEVGDATDDWAVVGKPGLTYELVERDRLEAYADEAGAPVGVWAWEASRIASGQPRLGLDTDERAIPNELGWLTTPGRESAVHLDKGCYRGQETVARVHTLGRPPRRLTLLYLDGSAERLPVHGSALTLDERTVGFVGSTARHYELGPIALGVVKRNVPTDATLLADDVAASQEVLVDPEVGLHVRASLR
ncbi:CAF17-like 4Fe-4S cluster assembly/insertion protein YgfZ [Solicola gregarius]|uniref:Folate-binding protein n=1 Tax=Solicola gregarius TaxID=2908642 RepID=A0AA46TL33_9ACTN|nr:folate-binding protein [Solicola gregarius]UYM06904.1 folate-binding protein [Solicola gregarius]